MTRADRLRGRLGTFRLWLTPGMGVKRYVTLAVGGVLILIVGAVGLSLWAFGDERSSISESIEDFMTSSTWYMLGEVQSAVLLVGGAIVAVLAVAGLNR